MPVMIVVIQHSRPIFSCSLAEIQLDDEPSKHLYKPWEIVDADLADRIVALERIVPRYSGFF